MAMGGRSAVISETNKVRFVNGTSFSCPILAGAVTCLWQAFPNKRPTEIIKAVQQSGNFANHPNEVMGYGIPDLKKAYEILFVSSSPPKHSRVSRPHSFKPPPPASG